jgi:putative dimethyl sulfoxide reductase chaperone
MNMTENPAKKNPAEASIQKRLRRAALFRHLALLVSEPGEDWKLRVLESFHRMGAVEDLFEGDEAGVESYRLARNAWEAAASDRLATEYVRLFLLRDSCSIHETSYGDGRRMAGRENEMADIAGFYTAFGLELSGDRPDLPDHLATELEFYSALLMKGAYAESCGLTEAAEIVHSAAARFLESHLGRWPAALREAVEEQRAASPYPESFRMIEIVAAGECARMKVEPAPFTERLPAGPLESDTLSCPNTCPLKAEGQTQ